MLGFHDWLRKAFKSLYIARQRHNHCHNTIMNYSYISMPFHNIVQRPKPFMYNTISLYLSPWIEIYYLCKQIDVLFHKIHFILPSVAVCVYINCIATYRYNRFKRSTSCKSPETKHCKSAQTHLRIIFSCHCFVHNNS